MNKNYISKRNQDLILNYLQARLNPNLSDYQNLFLNKHQLGLLSPKFRDLLLKNLSDAEQKPNGIHLYAHNWQSMADILTQLTWNWHEQATYNGWRNELFDVYDEQKNRLFQLERSAFRPLGLKSQAIHLNAWCWDKNKNMLHWIAKRGSHKTVSPNLLDNITCGGVSAGESPFTALQRESYEEAGITPNQLSHLSKKPDSYFSYRIVHRGVHREFLHVYNLQTNLDFTPTNHDGEVNYFQLMHNQEIVNAILNKEFMLDSVISLLPLWLEYNQIDTNGSLANWLKSIQI